MASQLEIHREAITDCCEKNNNNAEIEKTLHAAGCTIGRERIRVWVMTETLAGRLRVRKPSGRGRPPRGKAASASSLPEADSLSNTDPLIPAAVQTFDPAPFAKTFEIPVDQSGNLDLNAWARNLGAERLQCMSDLEYFFLESLEQPWREDLARWTERWVVSVFTSARVLRQQMLEVARTYECIQTVTGNAASPTE